MPAIVEVVLPDSFFAGAAALKKAGINLTADDRLDILELVCRFEWSFDARRLDKLAEILTDDVVIDHVFGYRAGKKDAMDMMRSVVASVGLRHQATNPVIFLNDDGEVSVLSYLFVVEVMNESGQGAEVPRNLGHAVVTDVVRKEDGQWKIARRTFEQMVIPPSFLPDASQRRELEQTASQRASARTAHA